MNEDSVKKELANERLENVISTLHEASAGVTAVSADAIVAEGERQTVMELLIAAGICSHTSYVTLFADKLSESIAELAEKDLIDINAIIDAEDGVAGES